MRTLDGIRVSAVLRPAQDKPAHGRDVEPNLEAALELMGELNETSPEALARAARWLLDL